MIKSLTIGTTHIYNLNIYKRAEYIHFVKYLTPFSSILTHPSPKIMEIPSHNRIRDKKFFFLGIPLKSTDLVSTVNWFKVYLVDLARQ